MTATSPRLGAAHLVLESIRLMLPRFGRLFPIAFVPSLALTLFTLSPANPFDPANPPGAGTPLGLAVLVGAAAALAHVVIAGVLFLAALDAERGRRRPVGDHLARTYRHIGPLIGAGLVVLVLFLAGLALLVVPGLYVLARFFPWLPAVLDEEAGWPALARAQALTEGYRWPLAGALVLFYVAGFVVPAPAYFLAAASGPVAGAVLEAAGGAVFLMLSAIFTALVYLRLREVEAPTRRPRKEPWS